VKTRPTVEEVVKIVGERVVGEKVVDLLPAGHQWKSNNKGIVGVALEQILGIPVGSGILDLADGELKTNQTRPENSGKRDETIAVCSIGSSGLAHLTTINKDPNSHFAKSRAGQKLSNVVIVQILKPDTKDPSGWTFSRAVHITGALERDVWESPITGCGVIYQQLSKDYYKIATEVTHKINAEIQIGTCSGELLQIRTKDSRPYKPLVTQSGFVAKDKQMAFYLKSGFFDYVLKTAPSSLI
jgi:DNA mismatch repair protein MutH